MYTDNEGGSWYVPLSLISGSFSVTFKHVISVNNGIVYPQPEFTYTITSGGVFTINPVVQTVSAKGTSVTMALTPLSVELKDLKDL